VTIIADDAIRVCDDEKTKKTGKKESIRANPIGY